MCQLLTLSPYPDIICQIQSHMKASFPRITLKFISYKVGQTSLNKQIKQVVNIQTRYNINVEKISSMFKIIPQLVIVYALLSCGTSQRNSKQKFKKCPRSCECFKATGTKGLDVICSNKKLTDLPVLPNNTITL